MSLPVFFTAIGGLLILSLWPVMLVQVRRGRNRRVNPVGSRLVGWLNVSAGVMNLLAAILELTLEDDASASVWVRGGIGVGFLVVVVIVLRRSRAA